MPKRITFVTQDRLMSTRLTEGAPAAPGATDLANPFFENHGTFGEILKTPFNPAIIKDGYAGNNLGLGDVSHSIIVQSKMYASNAPFKIVDDNQAEIRPYRASSWNMNDAIMIGGSNDIRPLPGIADRLFQRSLEVYDLALKIEGAYIPQMAYLKMSEISGIGAMEVSGESGTDYETPTYVGGIDGSIMFLSYIELTIDYYLVSEV